MNMVLPYLACQLLGGVLGAAMAKVSARDTYLTFLPPVLLLISGLTHRQQAMTSVESFAKAHGGAFAVLQSREAVGRALFGEVAMTCLVTLVLLLGAVNAQTRSPMVPFLVGCTVTVLILAG